MTPATATSWAAIRDEVQRLYGWTPQLAGALDAYRPLSGNYYAQTETFLRRYTTTYLPGHSSKRYDGRTWWLKSGQAMAAVPGTSNHGWGTSADVANLGGFTGERYRQFAAVATRHGWSNTEGRSIGEAWHWSNVSATAVSNAIAALIGISSTPTTALPDPLTPEDDLMADWTYDEARRALGALDTLASWLPSIKANADRLPHIHAQADLIVSATSNITNGVVTLLGRAVSTGTDPTEIAKAIAAALPDTLAEAVADELRNRLTN